MPSSSRSSASRGLVGKFSSRRPDGGQLQVVASGRLPTTINLTSARGIGEAQSIPQLRSGGSLDSSQSGSAEIASALRVAHRCACSTLPGSGRSGSPTTWVNYVNVLSGGMTPTERS